MANHRLEDMLACPHILQLANRRALLRLAARYLGCAPTLSALRLRWSFPGWGWGPACRRSTATWTTGGS